MSVGWFCCQILVFPTGMSVTGLGISPYKHFTTKTSVNERSSLVHLGNQAVTRSIKFIIRSTSVLWSAICLKIMIRHTCGFAHVYLQSFLLHDIRVFFWHVYLHSFLFYGVFSPKYMTIFLQTRIYMCSKKANIYALQTSMCIWGQRKSSYKWHRIIPSQKDPSCTMELKSNFSLKFSLV